MRTKFFAIGLAFVLPLMVFSQSTTTTTQKPPQPKPAAAPATQQTKPAAAPTVQQTRPTAVPATQQPVRVAPQQTQPATGTQPTVRQVNVADGVVKTDRERIGLEPAERGGGRPYRELLDEKGRIYSRYFSEQELEPRFLSTILWEVTGGENREDADAATAAETTTAADGTVASISRTNIPRVLDVYVLTRDYIALYNRDEQSLEVIAKFNDETETRKNILGKNNLFAERAPLVLIYVASNQKLSRIPVNKRDFYAAADCGMAVQSAYFFCASENLVTTTMEIDPIAVGRILGLRADKVLLAQPVGFR